MNELISKATENNWTRLKTQSKNRLTSRANKRRSQKKFIPTEYLTHHENIQVITDIIELASQSNANTECVLFSIGCMLLKNKGIFNCNHVQSVLIEYPYSYIDVFESLSIPYNEKDLLGVIYQGIQSEGSKNISGSYYTPALITDELCSDIRIEHHQKVLDPCCGSGAFLLAVECEHPDLLYGFDIDPIAVMLAKFNLLLKYSAFEFIPHIYCFNYLSTTSLFDKHRELRMMKFNYVITNPPWGAMQNLECSEISSGETFSYFFVKAFHQLEDGGIICFLFPEAVANIKLHRDIRKFILQNTMLYHINLYERKFTGVLTKHIAITCKKSQERRESVLVISDKNSIDVRLSRLLDATDYVFSFSTNKHQTIIEKIAQNGRLRLDNSEWALGIVTGNNKELLHKEPELEDEIIYTGKEVEPFVLGTPKYYIKYDRNQFQQVAKDCYYRANEKLVYRFISNNLVFAYDNRKSLLLNSANILIPKIQNMNIKTVLAFLNSYVLQFYYVKKFNVLKVLKSNLLQLPFPEITKEQNVQIEKYVNQIIQTNKIKNNLRKELEELIAGLYKLTTEEFIFIKEDICKNY